MKSIDPLLNRKFDRNHYHCVHFLLDAGQHLFDYDYKPCFLGLTGSLNQTLNPSKDSLSKGMITDQPSDGSIMLALTLDNKHHVGLYYCGRILHLSETGPRFETLRSIKHQYKEVKFYDIKDFSQ